MSNFIDFFFSGTEDGDSSNEEQFLILRELSSDDVVLPDVVNVAQSNIGSIDSNTTDGRNMESIVIPKEVSMLLVGIENVIKSMFKRHVGLEENIVGNEVSAPEITNNDGVVPELSPFK